MKYTIRPKGSSSAGGFAVTAIAAREALERVKELVERGLSEVQIFDAAGKPYVLAALEQQATEAEKTPPVNRRGELLMEGDGSGSRRRRRAQSRASQERFSSVVKVLFASTTAATP